MNLKELPSIVVEVWKKSFFTVGDRKAFELLVGALEDVTLQ
jgi:hypothetical protein